MAMFSDFSLKALINCWKADVLGPNPFVKIGETSQLIDLKFENKTLQNCPSAQLQIVGELAEGGKCNVHAISGTIVYTVNSSVVTDAYKL